MNLQLAPHGLSATSPTSANQVKRAWVGSDSCGSSTDRSEGSGPEEGTATEMVEVVATDVNQNCTSPLSGLVPSVCLGNLGEEDSIRLTAKDEVRRPTEEELLRQLEEANRLLEADEKSYAVRAIFSSTPGHSRKGSESSIVSSASSNSFYSQQNSLKVEDSNEDSEPNCSPPASSGQRGSFKRFRIRINSLGGVGDSKTQSLPPEQVHNDHVDSPVRGLQTKHSMEEKSSSGHNSESVWETWGRIINDWDSVRKKPAVLRELVRKGIPHEFRGMAWQLILGVHDSPWKLEYAEHMKKKSPCEKLIRRDIARTFPDHDFFKEKDGFGQESLFNVMKAYSLHDREVGYCQGSGFIVGLLLMQMPEEDAFAVLVHLMQEFRLRELFKPSMAELGLCMYKLECLIQELLPTLVVHFQTQNFDTSMYASSWFLTLFVTSLPLSLARRIMDLFISEGMEMIFRVAVAILQSCQEELLTLDMEGLLKYLQKDLRTRFEVEADQDNLLQTAFNLKYSQKKMKKLEKEYTALKTKENEDQVELRRLRTENRLLRQRIENLEKESSTLADKLVQDQVTWAQEVEQSYALRNEISVLRQQLQETQKKLLEAEDILGDIRTRTRIIEDAVHLDEAEERNMVKHLQEELIAVRLRETDTAITIKELRQKVADLEDSNLRLQRAPSNDVQQLQEELIAVKLREAEANLSMKELRMKVNEIESYWEAHMERVRQSSPKEKGTKQEVRHLQEEVMALKLKEARAVADVKDVKQKLMELETQNHICTNQIRRIGEENKELKKQLEEAAEREKDLKINIKDLTRKLDDTETKRREEAMMARIKDAENIQLIADLRRRIAEIDIQKEEVLAAGQLQDKGENQELKNKLHDLQDEVLQLQLSLSSQPVRDRCVMTDSYLGNNSDEELDAELRDSENLDRTLSDIIEGKNNASSVLSGHDIEDASSSVSGINGSRCSVPSSSNLSKSANSVVEPLFGLHDDRLSAHLETSSTNLPGGSILGSGGGGASTSVSASSSRLTSHGASDSSQQYSGESTVINKCDRAQGGQSPECQGKILRAALRSHVVSQVVPPIAASASPHPLVQSGKTHIYQGSGSQGQRSHKLPEPASLDISRSWELYEEEVELDSSLEARVVSRISAVQDFRAGVTYRETMPSSDRFSHIPQTRPVALDPNGNAAEVDNCYQDDYAAELEKSYAGDAIPDVVVIYEPSCGPGSLICTCDGGQESEFILKESTV